MKSICTFLICYLCCLQWSTAGTFDQLKKINHYWSDQAIDLTSLPELTNRSNHDWIRTHLYLVENNLRSRPLNHLSPEQQKNRLQSLDDLHDYMLAGAFPINDTHDYKTPIFIDPYDNFCAVGYLIKASGQEALFRKIAKETNLAYVKEMKHPALLTWANNRGFTVDELAWIQPTYGPPKYLEEAAGGVDGEVHKLLPVVQDESKIQGTDRLYIGGNFVAAGGDPSIRGIAFLSPTDIYGVYDWNGMGEGLPGTVHDIIQWDGSIIAAGMLEETAENAGHNVMQWTGTEWQPLGCLNGVVHSMAVVDGQLYVGGAFTLCGQNGDVNFAHWQNGEWIAMSGLEGRVNALMPAGEGGLYIGGLFAYNGDNLNVIHWNSTNGFLPFENGSKYEVNGFGVFNAQWGNGIAAVCSRPLVTDSIDRMLIKLEGAEWIPAMLYFDSWLDVDAVAKDLYTIGMQHDQGIALAGGVSESGISILEFSSYMQSLEGAWRFDDDVNDITIFQKQTFIGGAFTKNFLAPLDNQGLAGLARYYTGTSINEIDQKYAIDIYPNPVSEGRIFVRSLEAALQSAELVDMQGRSILQWPLSGTEEQQQLDLPLLTSGLYFLKLSSPKGKVRTEKVVVQ